MSITHNEYNKECRDGQGEKSIPAVDLPMGRCDIHVLLLVENSEEEDREF